MVTLSSGLEVDLGDPVRRFFAEEWAYYDGIADSDPDHIVPVDVLATVAVNSFVSDAAKVRRVHRALAEVVDSVLVRIPADADLRSFDPDLDVAADLLTAACTAREVQVAVATKVLHRKRRSFVPMLDNVVIDAYVAQLGRPTLTASGEKARAAELGVFVWKAFRVDLLGVWAIVEEVAQELTEEGMPVTPLRVLEVAVWIATEERGYYRGPDTGRRGGALP